MKYETNSFLTSHSAKDRVGRTLNNEGITSAVANKFSLLRRMLPTQYSVVGLLGGFVACALFSACTGEDHSGHDEHTSHADVHGPHESGEEGVHFSGEQFDALEMEVGPLPRRNLSSVVEANGQLEVPPQNEATVTAILGANVVAIQVIEGDSVKKGQVLAYLSHPNLTRLQSDYAQAHSRLQFLEQEFARQQRLYEEEVGSGKAFQQTRADYQAQQATVSSYAAQLRQLGLRPARIQQGKLYDQVPVVSPIQGFVTEVEVKTGQYVPPEQNLFEIVNTHHIHADLMVFEKDVYRVEEGQRIRFTVATLPDQELYAEIYSVGKKFEQEPKAVHVHAEIKNTTEKLIPGMYIRGQILTDSTETFALPETALTREGEQYLAFRTENEDDTWQFHPVPVVTGASYDGWVGVTLPEGVPKDTYFALNNAYYLEAEMKKGEAEHSH